MLPETGHLLLLFYVPLVKKKQKKTTKKTLFSASMDDFKCSRVKEQDASFEAERKGPLRLFLENEMRKAGGGGVIFAFQQGCYDIVTWRCFKDKNPP